MKITVIGGKGFIGSHVVERLSKNFDVYVPEKSAKDVFEKNLGTVIYCAGNGDCVNTPQKVVDSNTSYYSEVLEKARFERMIYLSSTRLYIDNDNSKEDAVLTLSPNDPRRLFNLTKLASEELSFKSRKNVLLLRPSNVYGAAINSPLFLPMIVKNALTKGKIDMYVPPTYAKDYLSVNSLCDVIESFVQKREWSGVDIYNVASGNNVTAKEIADIIQNKTNCEIVWHPGFSGEIFPPINIVKLKSKMHYTPGSVLKDLEKMIEQFRTLI